MEFLVDYIDLSNDPDDVINTLNAHFTKISRIENLIHMLMNIEYDEDNAGIKLAKLVDNCKIEVIIKIITNEWGADEVHKEKLIKLFSKSEKYSNYELIHRVNENKESVNKNDLLIMLEFCEEYVTENNIESFINIMEYLLTNYLEKDVCDQILMRISNLTKNVIVKHRESICMILVEIFRKSSSEENRRRSSIIIKDKGLSRKIRNKLDENELKEYRSYLS